MNISVFFSLLQAGLWEQDVQLVPAKDTDWRGIFQLAEEQSVTGLIAAGLEHAASPVPKSDLRPFLMRVLAVEDTNSRMNRFIEQLMERLRAQGIQAVLVKGQGVAQCYARPLWRSCGDVDLLFDAENYEKAKAWIVSEGYEHRDEIAKRKHLATYMGDWEVELHGTMRGGLWPRVDKCIDAIQHEVFSQSKFRVWKNGGCDVLLPAPEEDAMLVFCHIQKHFFRRGIGLRQICDWCRLLWTYRDSIDRALLARRLDKMGLRSEWKAFAAFAVQDLGMPVEAMPFYDAAPRWKRKARRIRAFILRVGNFGHNRDMSYYRKYPFLIRKTISLGRRLADFATHVLIFPLDSLRFLLRVLIHGFGAAMKGI